MNNGDKVNSTLVFDWYASQSDSETTSTITSKTHLGQSTENGTQLLIGKNALINEQPSYIYCMCTSSLKGYVSCVQMARTEGKIKNATIWLDQVTITNGELVVGDVCNVNLVLVTDGDTIDSDSKIIK